MVLLCINIVAKAAIPPPPPPPPYWCDQDEKKIAEIATINEHHENVLTETLQDIVDKIEALHDDYKSKETAEETPEDKLEAATIYNEKLLELTKQSVKEMAAVYKDWRSAIERATE